MDRSGMVLRAAAALAAVALVSLACGCAQLGSYAKYRADDALEMGGIGVTVTRTPQFAAYADGVSVAPGGYAKLDGTFIGYGGGQFGATRHYTHSVGLVGWGYEEFGWGDFDREVPGTLDRQHVGALGLVTGNANRRPAYAPACIHYLHLGYVGLVGNLRYLEMLDFMLGFAAIDLCGDDGRKYSEWPWERRGILTRFEPPAQEAYTVCQKCGGYHALPKGVDGPGAWSPFEKIGLTGKGKAERPAQEPRLCTCARPRPEVEARSSRADTLSVARRETAPSATTARAPAVEAVGRDYDPEEARRLSHLRP